MHLILFDVDGTLIRGRGMGREAMMCAFGDVFGRQVEDYPAVRDVFIAGSTDQVIFDDMARAFGLGPEFRARYAELERSYLGHLRRTVSESVEKQPCPGVPGLLKRLHPHPGISLALLTGNLEPGARIKLEPFGLNRYFDLGGFGSDHQDRSAMARMVWDRVQERSGGEIPPHRVVVVGDTVRDVAAGRDHGFLTAGVTTGWSDRETLVEAGADRVFEDLRPENGFERWLESRWDLDLSGNGDVAAARYRG